MPNQPRIIIIYACGDGIQASHNKGKTKSNLIACGVKIVLNPIGCGGYKVHAPENYQPICLAMGLQEKDTWKVSHVLKHTCNELAQRISRQRFSTTNCLQCRWSRKI